MFKRIIATVLGVVVMFCSAVVVEAATKPDQWLVYWYVCATDIETTNIAFDPNTDLMSDDPSDLILAEPDMYPGYKTGAIKEVEKAELSPNVKIFMQAGGTYVWGHPKFRDNNAKFDTRSVIAADNYLIEKGMIYRQWYLLKSAKPLVNGKMSRYVYDKYHRKWNPYEQFPISGLPNTETDMGSQEGLISFLKAGQELERKLYPDGNVRRVLIFVDHGGGTLMGVCADEYTKQLISLPQLRNAFAAVKDGWTNPDQKPFEVIAFDACIMSTYETAVALEDSANYMVASQESTYSRVGLGYTDLLNDLSRDPEMSGAQLGKVICDTYWKDTKDTDKQFNMNTNVAMTMSVVDLSTAKMDALKTAYANFSSDALRVAQQNPEEFIQNFTKFKNAANSAEKFSVLAGVNNAVDLKNFAENVRDNFTEMKKSGDALVTAIKNSVIYQKRGGAFTRGGGLSTYYPFDLLYEANNIETFKQLGAEQLTPAEQGQLYEFLNSEVTSNLSLVDVINPKTGKVVMNPYTHRPAKDWVIPKNSLFDLSGLANETVYIDEDKKTAWIELSEDKRKGLESVQCQLLRVRVMQEADGTEKLDGLLLGGNSNMSANWQTGMFESSFRGKWITLGGNTIFVQIVSDSTKKDKNGKKIGGTELYVAPILLNEEPYKLFISCDYPREKFTIIGATKNEDAKVSLPSGEIRGFSKGDVVTPTYIYFKISEDEVENLSTVPGSPITIGDSLPKVEMSNLPDGTYFYLFEFVNPIGGKNNNVFAKEIAVFKVADGKVVEAKHLDDVEELAELKD